MIESVALLSMRVDSSLHYRTCRGTEREHQKMFRLEYHNEHDKVVVCLFGYPF
jgi:hypothetical protein